MINTIINFLKSLFIKDKEKPSILTDVSMEALHNMSITGDDVAKALGHMMKMANLSQKYKRRKKKCQSSMI